MNVYASEEEQVEAIKKWWKENGTSVILGIVIGSVALFGWRFWQGHLTAQGEQASMIYANLEKQLAGKKIDEATALGKQLMENYQMTSYASFAALELAKVAVDASNTETAMNYLRWVIENGTPEELRQTATMRLARLYLNSDNADSAWALITTLDENNSLSSYHELKGDILLAQGKQKEAKTAYLQASALTKTAPGSNSSLEMKLDDLGR